MPERMNCPKCGVDISDTWQPDEPDVGIIGGWYCDVCDLAPAAHEYPREPMEDDVDIFASTRGKPPDPPTRCPAHPDAIPEMGYGLAGGGIGPYSYCPICARVINKFQDSE